MTDQGPFREQDPVLSRLDRIDSTLREVETHLATPTLVTPPSTRTALLAPWLGSPLIIVALAWGVSVLFGSCSEGCRADAAAEQRRAQTDADRQMHEHERFCAALGLRFAGTTPVAVMPEHVDNRGFSVSANVFYGVVCGNGHGDGMYVGVDGHLHALKGP